MQDFQGWTLPVAEQGPHNGYAPRSGNYPQPSPAVVTSSHSDYVATSSRNYHNVQNSPPPTQQEVNIYGVLPPRISYSTSSVGSSSPISGSYGSQYHNAHENLQVLTPSRDQPPKIFNMSPQNTDSNYYPSPPMSQGSWNVSSPETATKTTVEGQYGKASYNTTLPSRSDSPSSVSPNDRPLTRPTVAVNTGYEDIPAFPIPQQKEYHPVADIRQEVKTRQQREHLMLRPGIRPRAGLSLERMATSTRRRKSSTPVPNHQTINAFKYKLDHDREEIARGKALDLMNLLNP